MKITQSRLIPVFSSHGSLVFDSVTGKCDATNFHPDSPGGQPDVVDVAELVTAYGELRDSELGYDILDVGYWTADGTYEPPCAEWRTERDDIQLAELIDECSAMVAERQAYEAAREGAA